jgi:hypothetical protein
MKERPKTNARSSTPTPTAVGGPAVQMPFSAAIALVAAGRRITKLEWDNPSMYLALVDERLVVKKADGTFAPVLLSSGDLLGTDWVVL